MHHVEHVEFTGAVCAAAIVVALLVAVSVCTAAFADEAPAVVCNVKVLSDKVPDVSSLDAWKASVLKPGMSDRDKALAIWTTVVQFRHQNQPPREFLQFDGDAACVHDFVKTANVYGYGMCCCAASNIESLARAAGLPARGRALSGHSLPEIYYDGAWHMFDASLITYFRNAKGEVASIDEIIEGVAAWYKDHPEMKGKQDLLTKFMKGGGWRKGPAVLANCDYYSEDGWFPAGTHGWRAPMSEFDGSVNYPCEYPYSEGYRVNVQLRDGEVLTRNWSNKGLHIDMDLAPPEWPLTSLDGKIGEGEFAYAAKFGDLSNGRIGNGTLVYDAPIANPLFAKSALAFENLTQTTDNKFSSALRVKSASAPGVFIIRMPSPYVYLSGTLSAKFIVGSGGSVKVSLSRNNGVDWKEIYSKAGAGQFEEAIDLRPYVYRLYDYRLKFELTGADTTINSLHIEHDIQQSQRALPALGPGDNVITFSAAPAESTITIEGFAKPAGQGNQLCVLEYHPVLDGVAVTDAGIQLKRDGGALTFPVETSADMLRIRFGCSSVTAKEADGWDILASFDDGKTWKKAGSVRGATPGITNYVTFADVPAATRKALVRFAGSGTTTIIDWRIDADYAQPNAGFRPVQITYVWQEGAAEKRDVHVAKSPQETYTIVCSTDADSKPVMKSLVLELADLKD